MRGKSHWTVIAVAAAVVFAVLVIGQFWRGTQEERCNACHRTIHSSTRTAAIFEGHRESFCCPSCALAAHRQSRAPVSLLRLTDFETGARLRPDQAVLVRGSDVNLCMRDHVMVGPEMHVSEEQFDRCSPGILAFSTRAAATNFAAIHGGEVLGFPQMAAAFEH